MTKYTITHSYAINPTTYNVKFKTRLQGEALSETIAYLMFLSDEIKHASELGGIELVLLLKSFYDNTLEILDDNEKCEWIIDEYFTWEYHCSNADSILNNAKYHRKGLKQTIAHMLNHNEELLKAGV